MYYNIYIVFHSRRIDVLQTKEFKTFEQQISGLETRKLKFKNKTRAIKILSKYNYFDVINGFESILLNKSSPQKEYKNVYFEDFIDLYRFDMELKKHTLFFIFDIESRLRTSISYHFAQVNCNCVAKTMNYTDPSFYQQPSTSDKYLSDKFKYFDLFKKLYKNKNKTYGTYIDELKDEKEYISQYTNPPFWVTIKGLPFGTLYFTFLFLKQTEKNNVLNDFNLKQSDEVVFTQSLYFVKELRNYCAHLELLTRLKQKRVTNINYYNDLSLYIKLSNGKTLNYMDALKNLKIYGNISTIKKCIILFYIKMLLKGRRKIAKKLLGKMGQQDIMKWIKL